MKGKKIMGLPIVVWMGVVAGGLLLGLWLRHKGSSNPGDGGSIDAAVAGGGIAPASPGMDQSTLAQLLGGRPVAAVGGPGVNSSSNPDGSVDFFDAAGNRLGSWMNVWNSSSTPVYNIPSSGGSGSSAASHTTQVVDQHGAVVTRADLSYFSGGKEYTDWSGTNKPAGNWKYDPNDKAWRSDWDPNHPGYIMGET